MSRQKTRVPDRAMIPTRAACDPRLTGAHLCLLIAIAAHDCNSQRRQSAGCYATREVLAEESGNHPHNIARLNADLVEWGYLAVEVHPTDQRRRVRRVVYQPGLNGAGVRIIPKQSESTDSTPRESSMPQSVGSIIGKIGRDPASQIGREIASHELVYRTQPRENRTQPCGEIGRRPNSQAIDFPDPICPRKEDLKEEEKKMQTEVLQQRVRKDCAEAPDLGDGKLQFGQQLDRLEGLGIPTRRQASLLLFNASPEHQAEFADPATSDERILEILSEVGCGYL